MSMKNDSMRRMGLSATSADVWVSSRAVCVHQQADQDHDNLYRAGRQLLQPCMARHSPWALVVAADVPQPR